jgi:signal transduction histidine kinase
MHAEFSAPEEVAQQLALADAGELAGPLAHEVNNFLNVVLLQMAALEQRLPAANTDLAEVRRQGKQLAELVKHWQRARDLSATPARPLDLNQLLQRLVAEAAASPNAVSVRLTTAPHLPMVLGIAADVHRLCWFLLKNAISAASQGQAQVWVRAEPAENAVCLRIEDAGADLPAESVSEVFEPSYVGRPGTERLELAACRSIVRRLNGRIHAENRPGGGLVLVVELPCC